MRAGTVFHPDYFYHVRPTVNSTQLARVEVFEPSGEHAEWVRGEGIPNTFLTKVWEGHARLQPNKDWRARVREVAHDFDGTHAIRIQLPIGENEYGAVKDDDGNFISYGEDPDFGFGYVVRLIDSPVLGNQSLENTDFTVRNAMRSSNSWLYNLLCDVGTK